MCDSCTLPTLGPHTNRWAIKVAEALGPLKNLLQQEVLAGPLINADETIVQVLKEPGRSPKNDSFMWVFRGGPSKDPVIYFQYTKHKLQTDDNNSEVIFELQNQISEYGKYVHYRYRYPFSQISGFSHIRIVGFRDMDFRKSGFSVKLQKCRFPDIWTFGNSDFRTPFFVGIRKS